jgi:hypothetical protein
MVIARNFITSLLFSKSAGAINQAPAILFYIQPVV